jgi:AcrR family transcriptional regulator
MRNSIKEAARGRREHILEAATTLFAEKGYDGISTRDLSRLVGINIATLYHYFPDKQSIYEEVLAEAQIRISDRLAEAASGSDPAPVRLKRFISSLVDIYSHETPDARLVDRQQLENSFAATKAKPERDLIWPTHVAVLRLITELYDGKLDDARTDEEARFLISLVYGATKLQPVHRIVGESDPYLQRPLDESLFDHVTASIAARRAAMK